MSYTWLITALIAAPTLGLAIGCIIVHRASRKIERDRRQGLLDLTGIQPRPGFDRSGVSRVRAEAGGSLLPVIVDERMLRRSVAIVGGETVDVFRVADGAHVGRTTIAEPTETELARRVATQQHPRGDDAA